MKNQINISAEVDCHKWNTLWERGGMVMDVSDTVTLKNTDWLYDSADKLKWSHYTIGVKQCGNGWLCINRPGGEICQLVVQAAAWGEQVMPVGHWEAKSFELTKTAKDVDRRPTDQKIVFGAHFTKMWHWIQTNTIELPDECLILHAYRGNVLCNEMQLAKRAFLNDYYADLPNWRDASNMITKTYAQSMENAGVFDVPALHKISLSRTAENQA